MSSFVVYTDHEIARERFIAEFVKRGPGTVGLEIGVSGVLDARRRFALAIQGWEKNIWIRPFLTRLEGHFERSVDDAYTKVMFIKRGLTLPLTFLSLLIPYSTFRYLLPSLESNPATSADIFLLVFSVLLVVIIGAVFYAIERQTHRLLIKALLVIYDNPALADEK